MAKITPLSDKCKPSQLRLKLQTVFPWYSRLCARRRKYWPPGMYVSVRWIGSQSDFTASDRICIMAGLDGDVAIAGDVTLTPPGLAIPRLPRPDVEAACRHGNSGNQ